MYDDLKEIQAKLTELTGRMESGPDRDIIEAQIGRLAAIARNLQETSSERD